MLDGHRIVRQKGTIYTYVYTKGLVFAYTFFSFKEGRERRKEPLAFWTPVFGSDVVKWPL